jgi:hypothetical protein
LIMCISSLSQKVGRAALSKCLLVLLNWITVTAQLAMFFSSVASCCLMWNLAILE